jgi:D-aspartate ligase
MADVDNRLTPAIVLGRGYTALGVLRSLALAGIPAYVACPAGDLATHSRWYRPPPGEMPWDGSVDSRTHEILRAMPLEHAILIPGADDAALWVADLAHSDLAARFRASSSSRQTLEILQDKARFGEFLAYAGIPHPRTFTINDSSDVSAIPFDELYRVFVKPVNSQQFCRSKGIKGLWADNRKQFLEIWTRLDAQGFKVIAQEYVPGGADDHYFIDGFCDRNGAFSGLFARRRIRIFPPDFGNSSYCQSIPLAHVRGAIASVVELLTRLRYRGIFSAEFKRDSRDGEFRLLEVNTRAWWYVEFAARCDVNVCQMAFQDAEGLPVTKAPSDYPAGIGCVNLGGDIKSVFSRDPVARISLLQALGQWTKAHYHVFRWDDPGPGLTVGWLGLRRLVVRVRGLMHRRNAAEIPHLR